MTDSPLRKVVAVIACMLAACGSSADSSAEEEHRRRDAELARGLADEELSEPSNPFRSAQTLAEDSIGAAIGQNLDQSWIRKMIEHQEGSARFADIMIANAPAEAPKRAAEKVRQDAHARIAQLKEVREGSLRSDPGSAEPFGKVVSETFGAMSRVEGANVTQTWALKMAAYDRGAVRIAGVVATRGQDPRIRELAREIASGLAHEADALERIAQSEKGVRRPSVR